jgi:hypothetical protein
MSSEPARTQSTTPTQNEETEFHIPQDTDTGGDPSSPDSPPVLDRLEMSVPEERESVPTIYMPTMDCLDDPVPIPFPPVDLPPTPAEGSSALSVMDYYEEAMANVSIPSDPIAVERFATLRLRDPEMSFEGLC